MKDWNREVSGLRPINNFIVWHRGECTIFKSETDAMDFIYKARSEDPNIRFDGWRQSVSGRNMVCLLSEADEVYLHDKAAQYLIPKPAPQDNINSKGDK